MTLEAGFCIFLFIAVVAVVVCALYRRALEVEPQHVPFHYETHQDVVGDSIQTWTYAMPVVPAAKPKPLPKGWQGWEGGECPVPYDTMVVVMQRNGVISHPDMACVFSWNHCSDGTIWEQYDTVAWRVA